MLTSTEQETLSTLEHMPEHVAIIMDGNGRWARARNMPRTYGHQAGLESLRATLRAASDFGISILTVYAFSTENWGRPSAEVTAIMTIFEYALISEIPELMRNGVRVRHLGREAGLQPSLVQKLHRIAAETANNARITLNLALNYGGRVELIDAFRQMLADGVAPEAVSEELVNRYLGTAGQPDPDLIIRTAGEMRLSNFLVWQSAYSEYYSTPVFWPDFNREELLKALVAFQQRKRRFGKLDSSVATSGA
ncbi:MAG: di-trans,poly-cis-decaprenylcistransferase [Chloroflexi bacterium]|nr:di-trans,poly-cis-decaprenylcistransferase [Chloroflexota bacterium]